MQKSLVKEKSYAFALNVIEFCRLLTEQREFVLSKQLLRAGTSIGANIEEALAGQSRADFIAKMSIASKEARESNYWLRLFRDSKLSTLRQLQPLLNESDALINMLTAIVKTATTKQVTKVSGNEKTTQNAKPKTQNK
ncbi:four helix bundle protein [Geomesophilobacter sediminis]|uniref:Four helix bundle protein n=1 Tax=Geomesophilobacter sediminis TaxID=2798584 RepID=A0A8J7M039_9BACT|nr:four helix bundle protein [Geomesophilobacter sediminis]MBJ6723177.1 four helix bundle protein [Geomesophilobacter sediminis]